MEHTGKPAPFARPAKSAAPEKSKARAWATRLLEFGVVAAIVVAGYLSYRNKQMDRLYGEAAGYPEFFRGTRQSTDAVRKLARYRGRRATAMLLDIALGHTLMVSGDLQVEAIKDLAMRDDPQVPVAVAELLQPQEGLDTRQAAATALQHLPCRDECNRSILHYLERIWRGEPNYEDRTPLPPDFRDVTASLQEDQQTLYGNLYSVLRRERMETLTNLVKVYGLGTDAPSAFALDLISRLGMRDACPLLLRSDQAIQRHLTDYVAPRSQLQSAKASLNCK